MKNKKITSKSELTRDKQIVYDSLQLLINSIGATISKEYCEDDKNIYTMAPTDFVDVVCHNLIYHLAVFFTQDILDHTARMKKISNLLNSIFENVCLNMTDFEKLVAAENKKKKRI